MVIKTRFMTVEHFVLKIMVFLIHCNIHDGQFTGARYMNYESSLIRMKQ